MTSAGEQHYEAQMERYLATVETATAEFRDAMKKAQEQVREFAESDLGKKVLESLTEEQQAAVLGQSNDGDTDTDTGYRPAPGSTGSGGVRRTGIFD
ncbi:MAG TPA: hypothetical protein H9751_07655 [Candidatus Corynebacterium faecigallinarum]|uniref:Uncharacterized protein n=1 Tax=Candidatus Corynebacterium faecigallinarum TaxID=2838528 RepID=A0A9D2QG02_9CORY|nr:hypothetical protein [Candidatus Corynebacterium faecigallinarum]